jgi:hypothetical protein
MTEERWNECTNHHEHEWEEQVATLKAEVERLKENYAALKDEFNRGAALAQQHCPKAPLGHSVFEGIPLLAAVVAQLKAHDPSKWRFKVHIVDCEEECSGPYNYVDLSVDDIGYADKGMVLSSDEPLVRLSRLQSSEAEVEQLKTTVHVLRGRYEDSVDTADRRHKDRMKAEHNEQIALAEKEQWILRCLNAEADVERLQGEISNLECDVAYWKEQATKNPTWQQERAAVAAFLRDRLAEETVGHSEFYPGCVADAISDIEDGEHWPEKETP